MKILIVGGGGREHAIAWKLAKSPKVEKLYCAPGNAGIAEVAECVNIGVMEFDKLVAFAKEHAIDLTVVAPDDPLAAGAVDAFEAAGLRAFGPRANAAIPGRLQGHSSKEPDDKIWHSDPQSKETFNDPEEKATFALSGDCKKMADRIKGRRPGTGKGVLHLQGLRRKRKAGVKTHDDGQGQFGSAGA